MDHHQRLNALESVIRQPQPAARDCIVGQLLTSQLGQRLSAVAQLAMPPRKRQRRAPSGTQKPADGDAAGSENATAQLLMNVTVVKLAEIFAQTYVAPMSLISGGSNLQKLIAP